MRHNRFYLTTRVLKRELQLEHTISVRRVKMPKDDAGDCYFDEEKDRYRIRVDRSLPVSYAVDVLLHEVAHAISWNQDQDDHGPNWGKAYALVYRTLLEHWEEVFGRH